MFTKCTTTKYIVPVNGYHFPNDIPYLQIFTSYNILVKIYTVYILRNVPDALKHNT